MGWFSRKPEMQTWTKVQWTPCPDITAYELALGMPVAVGDFPSMEWAARRVEKLPPEVSRHFTVTRTQGLVQL